MPHSKVIPRTPRFLSIQSHVVSGYCGNKSATLPLQLLGFEVDVINTVQLSNHTQYKVTKGQIFGSKDLEQIHAGLKENNLLKLYDCILSGYVADVSYIESMAKLIGDIKEARSLQGASCTYTLDPVLGDDGPGFYVPGGIHIAQAYKQHLLPLADIITPNRFEATILSGVQIDPKAPDVIGQAVRAMNVLHEQTNIKIVVITSLEIESSQGELVCLVSKSSENEVKNGDSTNCQLKRRSVWAINVPKLACPFTGTGDLFTALISGWLHKTNFDIEQSLKNTANAIQDILEDTLIWFHQVGDQSVQSHELRLVQNRDKILDPSSRFSAKLVDLNGSTGKVTGSLSNETKPDVVEC